MQCNTNLTYMLKFKLAWDKIRYKNSHGEKDQN